MATVTNEMVVLERITTDPLLASLAGVLRERAESLDESGLSGALADLVEEGGRYWLAPAQRRALRVLLIELGYFEDTTDNPWTRDGVNPAAPDFRVAGRRFDCVAGWSEWAFADATRVFGAGGA